jgi:hypothetical protein
MGNIPGAPNAASARAGNSIVHGKRVRTLRSPTPNAEEVNRREHVRFNFGFNFDADKLYQLLRFAK